MKSFEQFNLDDNDVFGEDSSPIINISNLNKEAQTDYLRNLIIKKGIVVEFDPAVEIEKYDEEYDDYINCVVRYDVDENYPIYYGQEKIILK